VRLAERDPALRLFERDAIIACGAMAACALAIQRGRPDAAAGVVAGGLLMALSYRAIKGAVDVLADTVAAGRGTGLKPRADAAGGATVTPDGDAARAEALGGRPVTEPALPARRRVVIAVKFFTRYALLAVGAYVMLACFHLHAAGLLVGATSPFVAAAVQVVRLSRAPSRREHP